MAGPGLQPTPVYRNGRALAFQDYTPSALTGDIDLVYTGVTTGTLGVRGRNLFLDPGAASRTVDLPPVAASKGVEIFIWNVSTTVGRFLTIRDSTGGTIYAVVGIGQGVRCVSNGSVWWVALVTTISKIYERITDTSALVGVSGGGADTETAIETVTIPASALKAGSRLRFKATCRITVGSTAGTLIVAARLGGTATTGQIVAQSAAADPGAALNVCNLEGEVIARAAPGATASCVHKGLCSAFHTPLASQGTVYSQSAVANQATSSALPLFITGIWNSATNDAVVVQDCAVWIER